VTGILHGHISTINKNTEALLNDSKEAGQW
jgi:hypothetical protein